MLTSEVCEGGEEVPDLVELGPKEGTKNQGVPGASSGKG